MTNWEEQYYITASKYDDIADDQKINSALDYLVNNLKSGERILEVGCGTARLADSLDRNIFYAGIDISEYALKAAKERFGDINSRTFIKASADELPFKDETFEAVLAKFSLEHFVKPRKSILEMIRILKDKGILIIIAPNLEFPFCFPTALRHKKFLFKLKFYLLRLYDYFMRLTGVYHFRVIKDNYLQATGKYEKKDDDLVYLVSSFEVINFLKKKNFKFIFINKSDSPAESKGIRRKIKRAIRYLPGMKYYGTELFIIAEKQI